MLKKLTLIAFSFIISLTTAQEDAVFCKQINAINQRLQQFHFRPKPLNDSLSKAVFKLFLGRLDKNKPTPGGYGLANDVANQLQVIEK